MDPLLLSILIFILTVLGCIALYQTVFGGSRDLGGRLSVPEAESGSRSATAPAERLVKWQIRRLRETEATIGPEQKLPETLTQAGFRGIESVARFQLGRFAAMGAGAVLGAVLCAMTGKPWLLGVTSGFLLGYAIPTVVVSRVARARRRKMTRELPDVLALIVVSLEAGISVGEVLRLVGRETLRQGGCWDAS